MKRAFAYLLLSALSAGATPGALAAYQVRFLDGRSLTAQAVDRRGVLTLLTLEGGGTVGVRTSRISEIRISGAGESAESPVPAPPAAAEARGEPSPAAASPEGPAGPSSPAAASAAGDGEDLLMGPGETGGYESLIRHAAARHGVDAELLRCVLMVESSFDPRAVSPKGARGLAQLMPATATELGVHDPFDAEESVDAAARLLGRLLQESQGRFVPALAAYNAGPGAVRRYGGVPPYGETIRYVEKILSLYHASPAR